MFPKPGRLKASGGDWVRSQITSGMLKLVGGDPVVEAASVGYDVP